MHPNTTNPTWRTLSTAAEHAAFSAEYAPRSGHPPSPEYLRGSTVRALVDGSGRLLAGYVICSDGDRLRYRAVCPDGLGTLASAACCEITCMWIDRGLTSRQRLGVYVQAIRDALATGRRYILGGSVIPKVIATQKLALPHVLYEGAFTGLTGAPHGQVYYGTRFTLLAGLALNALPWLLGRLRKTARPAPALPRQGSAVA